MSEVIELSAQEASQLEERIKNRHLTDGDYELLSGLLNTFFQLNQLLNEKKLSIKRLMRLFWKKSEKSRTIINKDRDSEPPKKTEKEKKPGHGKNGAHRYSGAKHIELGIKGLKSGDVCPECDKGKLYEWKPGKILRLTGGSPVKCRLYQIEKLRCALCQKIFKAQLPKEAGTKKYDEEAGSMVALLKYGSGMPFNRLGQLQENLGVPLPPSTQWEIVKSVSEDAEVIYQELLWQGAQGEIIHNDDTVIKILELLKENKSEQSLKKRTGIFTTGIISKNDQYKIALFISGRNHAGENLTNLLEQRIAWLPPPIQMCDALSRNLSPRFKTKVSYCLLHGRRNFVDILEAFPDKCKYVIEKLGDIYKNERIVKVPISLKLKMARMWVTFLRASFKPANCRK